MKYKFRPRNNVRLEKLLLKSSYLLCQLRPELENRIQIYFIDLGTEFGFTRKHMLKLFDRRTKNATTESQD